MSQQVTEPNNDNFANMTSTYIVHDDTIGTTPMPKFPTKIKYIIQYTREDESKLNLLFIIPMSKFIDDNEGFRWRKHCSEVLHSYMEKSVLFIVGNSSSDRTLIRDAVRLLLEYRQWSMGRRNVLL